MTRERLGPWPDPVTARSFLRALAGIESSEPCPHLDGAPVQVVADWLLAQQLASLAFQRCAQTVPDLAQALRERAYDTAAEGSLLARALDGLERALAEAGIPFVLLKGAALARTGAYDWSERPMADIDIWVGAGDMERAVALMQVLGYRWFGKRDRPPALMRQSLGEIQMAQPGRAMSLVELQWSPFPGWWLQRTAAVDLVAVWDRRRALAPGALASELAPEDMIIQLAVHLAVNHQFGMLPVRSLLDMVIVTRRHGVSWPALAARARQWRLATVVWQVLTLLQALFGLPEPDAGVAVYELRPGRWRRRWLQRFVSPEVILHGRLLTGRSRYWLLLLLVDRSHDMIRLIFRTLWPENEWLDMRYSGASNRWRHLWAVVRHGRV